MRVRILGIPKETLVLLDVLEIVANHLDQIRVARTEVVQGECKSEAAQLFIVFLDDAIFVQSRRFRDFQIDLFRSHPVLFHDVAEHHIRIFHIQLENAQVHFDFF